MIKTAPTSDLKQRDGGESVVRSCSARFPSNTANQTKTKQQNEMKT
jgi:hypothetical protein